MFAFGVFSVMLAVFILLVIGSVVWDLVADYRELLYLQRRHEWRTLRLQWWVNEFKLPEYRSRRARKRPTFVQAAMDEYPTGLPAHEVSNPAMDA